MYTRKQVVVLILASALIFSGTFVYMDKTVFSRCSSNNILRPGLEVAYDRLIINGYGDVVNRGYGFGESKEIGGLVKEVSEDSIRLKVNPFNALVDPTLSERKVKITSKTKILKKVEKSIEEYRKDMEAFNKELEALGDGPDQEPLDLPEITTTREISAMDLKFDDRVLIEAEKNIHNIPEFEANIITVQ